MEKTNQAQAPQMELKPCKYCQTAIPKKAKVCHNCKKKQGGKAKWIIIILIALCFIVWALGKSSSDETENNSSTTANTEKHSPDNNQTDVLSDGIIDVNIDDCHVKYIKHEIVKNMSGEKCVAIYYDFTNNSDEAKAFIYTIDDKCFQDGVELESSIFHVSDESHDSDVEIKPGKTVTVCSGFVLRDEENEIELEVSKWASFKDTTDDSMVLSLD